MISAYRDPDKAQGSKTMQALIDSLRQGVPTALIELNRLGRTLSRRAADSVGGAAATNPSATSARFTQ